MRNVLTIVRRELGAYFKSAIAYIFIIVFLVVSVGLFIWPFFAFPRADMRQFFSVLPVFLAVFIPAVTMRLWAEERKENTYEMLLTFPMETWELVLGKFLAGLAFFAVALGGTLTIPIMLACLGDPDGWAIFSAYLGTLLLGALFLAIGIFFSGLFKDQIVAFLMSLLACLGMYLVGTMFIAMFLDGWLPGFGSLLSDLLGVTGHFEAFTKGIIDLSDVLFFLIWTVLFLALNGMYIDIRERRGGRKIFACALAVSLAIAMLLNWVLADTSFGRFDMTEDSVYTVSDASKRILSNLAVPVQVKLYITPRAKMPTELRDLEQDILDKLEELRVASGGKVSYRAIHMEAANVIGSVSDEEEEKGNEETESLEKRLMEKGVRPFTVRAIRKGEMSSQLIYSSVGIAYKEKKEEIIPQIIPRLLPELEYRLVSTAYRLTREKQPVLAFFAPEEEFNITPQMRQMYKRMGRPIPRTEDPYATLQQMLAREKYQVRHTTLTRDDPMPRDADALIVLEPRDLNDRQKWEINRFLVQDKPVMIAAQYYSWDYEVVGKHVNATKRNINPNINDVLKPSGFTVDRNILMDNNNATLTISDPNNPLSRMFGLGMPVNVPTHILVNQSSMNADIAITRRVETLFYLWGTAVSVNEKKAEENAIRVTTLMTTSDKSWTVDASKGISNRDLKMDGHTLKRYPIMLLAEGQFKDAYEGKERPEWPPEKAERPGEPPRPPRPDPPAAPVEHKPGKLILTGGAYMFRKNFLRQGSVDLFINCVDALTLNPDLIKIRSRKPIERSIDKPSRGTAAFWRFVNLALANLIVAGLGIGGAVVRRRARNAYTIKHMSD